MLELLFLILLSFSSRPPAWREDLRPVWWCHIVFVAKKRSECNLFSQCGSAVTFSLGMKEASASSQGHGRDDYEDPYMWMGRVQVMAHLRVESWRAKQTVPVVLETVTKLCENPWNLHIWNYWYMPTHSKMWFVGPYDQICDGDDS